jgi:hypothetical protein
MRGREMFFDEINHRLANRQLTLQARENLNRYAEYADFRDKMLTNHRDLGDALLPDYRNGTFDFGLQFGEMPDMAATQSIDLAKVRSGQAVIYRQDTPTLNNLDWNVSIDRTLQQVIEGRLGKVVRLPRGDVAHFRPSVIYTPDHSVAFHKVTSQSSHMHLPTSYSACNTASDSCTNAPTNDNNPEQAYLVVKS